MGQAPLSQQKGVFALKINEDFMLLAASEMLLMSIFARLVWIEILLIIEEQ